MDKLKGEGDVSIEVEKKVKKKASKKLQEYFVSDRIPSEDKPRGMAVIFREALDLLENEF